MEGEQKRVFLVLADDEIAGIRPPKGIYFTKFLSAAQEMWISEKMMKQKRNPYVLTARSMLIPVFECRMEEGVPTIRPKKERTKENAGRKSDGTIHVAGRCAARSTRTKRLSDPDRATRVKNEKSRCQYRMG